MDKNLRDEPEPNLGAESQHFLDVNIFLLTPGTQLRSRHSSLKHVLSRVEVHERRGQSSNC
ncbi:MAG: hypothetical protein HN390_08525 [Anaerolineae bacterium]|nr:hypothetical protein [Anaerolineae bacterium]